MQNVSSKDDGKLVNFFPVLNRINCYIKTNALKFTNLRGVYYHFLPGRTESRQLKRDTQRLQMHAKQDTKENMRVFRAPGQTSIQSTEAQLSHANRLLKI